MRSGLSAKEIFAVSAIGAVAATGLVGGGLYFNPGTIQANDSTAGQIMRVEPISVPAVKTAGNKRGVAFLSVQLEVEDIGTGRDACYNRPRIQDLIQTHFSVSPVDVAPISASKRGSVKNKRLLKKIKKAAGKQIVKNVRIVVGRVEGDTVTFKKPKLPSTSCREAASRFPIFR